MKEFRIKVISYYDVYAECKEEALEQVWNNEVDVVRARTLIKEKEKKEKK